jgi:multiple sugar transport system substrate-binding protein
MSKFQIILLTVFGLFIIGAVLIFSMSRGSGTAAVNLTVWGPMSEYDFQTLTGNATFKANNINTTYVQESPATFDADFTEALAEGRGPDIVILNQANLLQEESKLSLIPYTSINQADFSNTFIEEGNLFAATNGVYALPLQVDPMVMYSNKELLDTAGIATPLAYWDQIYTYVNKLTAKDPAGNITQSTMALGESKNIPHAKEILSLLMLQAGTPIVSSEVTGFRAELLNPYNLPVIPGDAALDFYTQFSNPGKPFYSWNRSLQPAETSFLAGDTAFYIGFASEQKSLQEKNPNLVIGITAVPQSRTSGKVVTFGNLLGVAVVRNSPNQAGALAGAIGLISNESAAALAKSSGLPPARRDLLSIRPSDGVQSIFYDAALQARGWLDPAPVKTVQIFNDLIDSVTSGRARIDQALQTANNSLNALLPQ